MEYNPESLSTSKGWLAIDELERLDLVIDFHKRHKIKLPNVRLHSLIHVMVENQLTEDIKEVKDKMTELLSDGLSRHDAIHAIGSVLSTFFYEIIKGGKSSSDPNREYLEKLATLNANKWLHQKS